MCDKKINHISIKAERKSEVWAAAQGNRRRRNLLLFFPCGKTAARFRRRQKKTKKKQQHMAKRRRRNWREFFLLSIFIFPVVRSWRLPLEPNKKGVGAQTAGYFQEEEQGVFFEKISPPRRGIEPRSPAWQAGILTTILSRIGCRRVSLWINFSSPSHPNKVVN